MNDNITPAALAAAAAGDLANFFVASRPGGIERQEAEGQQSMIAGSLLPIKINNDGLTWENLVAQWGVSFTPADDLFYSVKLPAGWKVVPTKHSMNSLLVDERGRERAHVFYKAAFYDRHADLRLVNRYAVEFFVERDADNQPITSGYRLIDRSTNSVIETIGTTAYDAWDASDKLSAKARQRLIELFPDFENPFAYWAE